MLYKKGDVVRIRDDLIVGKEYGLYPIEMLDEMKGWCGKTGIVTDTNEKELAVKVFDWWWSEVMVTPVLDSTLDKLMVETNWKLIRRMNQKDAAETIAGFVMFFIRTCTKCGLLKTLEDDQALMNLACLGLTEFFYEYPELTP